MVYKECDSGLQFISKEQHTLNDETHSFHYGISKLQGEHAVMNLLDDRFLGRSPPQRDNLWLT